MKGGQLTKARSKNRAKRKKGRPSDPGCQWGDPIDGDNQLIVERVGAELEITAAMPDYLSEIRPCDLMRQYSEARKNRSIGTQRTGKDSPHIRFANADGDNELIDFVRKFGPVVCTTSNMLTSTASTQLLKAASDEDVRILLKARQNLEELRNEQKIYRAALSLNWELAQEGNDYDWDHAHTQIAEIMHGVEDWPRQWQREKLKRRKDPHWTVREESILRIVRLAESRRDGILPPQVDARIVLCEILNMFPSLAFPNPAEMHSYILFGIRPLLYSILRREFLQPHDMGVCANTHCREFFEVERHRQRFCDDTCSRQQRQREYWETNGRTLRQQRLQSQRKANR